MAFHRRIAWAGLLLGAALVLRNAPSNPVFLLGRSSGPFEVAKDGSLIARRGLSPYHTNSDREIYAKRRQQIREEMREAKKNPRNKPVKKFNFDALPEIQDVYNRKFTGDGDIDPIGGRKRYTLHVIFRRGDGMNNPNNLKIAILKHMTFFKKKLSCKKVKAQVMKSPIDGSDVTVLEAQCAQYGELPREQKVRNKYEEGTYMQYELTMPAMAVPYLTDFLYKDLNLLRHAIYGHTLHFANIGEDSELLL
mmetsp:Transcript_12558/g.22176  ORF Transcript_12558/g.22176 Transcript_12558/m.22176 type:complete len:250 (+) Transcript_12558:104-853(+)|eukprot:CAMPEP_0197649742 /NCGR_PEP_ID=MMETSP1338-20131121/29567_1 /TAXON_ID=43686 ORGANISM="Pelagodinium beii, Strain RCC1491" /NCGR_SAMPLE_ID=MMETSP1338 /ASSEMBLY_ACC=CAM_ASM_000754 /LENGTH=249 /DNA_ID=CAMNT_0043224005 /DNA_START=97 /DNA_END=846 /DNA_ORIENTATION=-